MSWSAKCSWKPDTPGIDPAGARISAGKSGSVDRSLPNAAVSLVKRSPVSCMPSPESPAKRIVTRSSTWTGLGIVGSLDSNGRVACTRSPPVRGRPGREVPPPPGRGRRPALPAYTDPFGKLVEARSVEWQDRRAAVTMPEAPESTPTGPDPEVNSVTDPQRDD